MHYEFDKKVIRLLKLVDLLADENKISQLFEIEFSLDCDFYEALLENLNYVNGQYWHLFEDVLKKDPSFSFDIFTDGLIRHPLFKDLESGAQIRFYYEIAIFNHGQDEEYFDSLYKVIEMIDESLHVDYFMHVDRLTVEYSDTLHRLSEDAVLKLLFKFKLHERSSIVSSEDQYPGTLKKFINLSGFMLDDLLKRIDRIAKENLEDFYYMLVDANEESPLVFYAQILLLTQILNKTKASDRVEWELDEPQTLDFLLNTLERYEASRSEFSNIKHIELLDEAANQGKYLYEAYIKGLDNPDVDRLTVKGLSL